MVECHNIEFQSRFSMYSYLHIAELGRDTGDVDSGLICFFAWVTQGKFLDSLGLRLLV